MTDNKPTDNTIMNEQTNQSLADASPAQLAFLALNGSYGEKLVATMLLESIARPGASWSEINPSSKGRWDV